jgi:hypothetical protein
MQVDVEHGLSGVRVRVEHRAEPSVPVPLLARNGRGPADHLANERVVFRGQRVEALDVLPGDDQRVQRRLGVDVSKGDEAVVLIND